MIKIEIKILNPKAQVPEYAHLEDSGMDLHSIVDVIINPFERVLIHTGISVMLPPNTEGQIRPRSGLASNHGITVLNSPGTIDEGYRGEIKVLLINLGAIPFHIKEGDRIAQLVIAPVIRPSLIVDKYLTNGERIRQLKTDRGESGFGSTGY